MMSKIGTGSRSGMPTEAGNIGFMTATELRKWLESSQEQNLEEGLVIVFGMARPSSDVVRAQALLEDKFRSSMAAREEEDGPGFVMVRIMAEDHSVPLSHEWGGLALEDVKRVTNKGKNFVVFGGIAVLEQCQKISDQLGINLVQLTRRQSKWPFSEDSGKTLVWVAPFTFACPLPIPRVEMVVSIMLPTRYYDTTTGSSLFGDYMDETEARYQKAYADRRTPVVMVQSYDVSAVRRQLPGLLLGMNGAVHHAEVPYAIHHLVLEDGAPRYMNDPDDKMLFTELSRQMEMQGLVKGKDGKVGIVVDPEIMLNDGFMNQMNKGLNASGLLWTSTCMIALAKLAPMSWITRRIAIRAAIVAAVFPQLMTTNGSHSQLVTMCRGPAAALAGHGWIWLTLGLWEAATRALGDGISKSVTGDVTVCGILTVRLDQYRATLAAIKKCEEKLEDGHAALAPKDWFERSQTPITSSQALIISELLMWAGLYNLVMIPKNPARDGGLMSLRAGTLVEWDKGVTCEVDTQKDHGELAPLGCGT